MSLADRALLALASAGLVGRVVLALASHGSNDASIWGEWAMQLSRDGVLDTYRRSPSFNHPPLIALLVRAITWLSETSGQPLPRLLKLPSIAADVMTAMLVYRIVRQRHGLRPALWAKAAFAWSAVSILITGFHCNTDSLCAGLCLLSFYCAQQSRPGWSGLALGAALNVKLFPLFLIPVLLLAHRDWRSLIRAAAGLVGAALPFAVLWAQIGPVLYRNLLAYNSNADNWGMLVWLRTFATIRWVTEPATAALNFYPGAGRYIILALSLFIAVAGRLAGRWNLYELGAWVLAGFLVFTPGFGVQYLVWVCPLLFAASVARGWSYSLIGGLFLFVAYFTAFLGGFPLASSFRGPLQPPALLLGLFCWAFLARYTFENAARLWRGERA